MTYQEAQHAAAEELSQAGVASADHDAAQLMMFVCGWNRTQYLLSMTDEMPEDLLARYEEAAAKRKSRIPLQHITGFAPFMGYMFKVTPDVLIPRPDTEMLVQRAGEFLNRHRLQEDKVLDLCTGSGCIAATIRKIQPALNVTGSDISPAALRVAEENGRRLGVPVDWVESDLFENISGRFDLIVSNPPYIPEDEIDSLEDEVRLHDPRLALNGGRDGLAFYRKIIRQAGDYLHTDGCLLLEIGSSQAEEVSELLKKAGFKNIRVYKDLSGFDRVAAGEI